MTYEGTGGGSKMKKIQLHNLWMTPKLLKLNYWGGGAIITPATLCSEATDGKSTMDHRSVLSLCDKK